MDTDWVPTEASNNGNEPQSGYVPANEEESASQDHDEGDETHEKGTPERPGKPQRKRGRIAKDPQGQTFLFHCRNAEDLETMLRDYLKDATSPPEHTTVEFHFPVSSAFMVYPPGHSHAIKDPLKRIFAKTALSVVDALQPTLNPKDQYEKQRSIGKVCVEACQAADGFKYGFHNSWISKEDQASRFSYFCNDSSLNKARAGNPAASNRVAHKKAQKPVYPCEGNVTIKFSVTKELLEVHYKHIPCHETYAARAPIPRKGTRRRMLMEIFEPDALPKPKTPSERARRRDYKAEKAQAEMNKMKKLHASRVSLDGLSASSDGGGGSAQPEASRVDRQDSFGPILELVNSIEAEAEGPAPESNERPLFPAEKLKDLQKGPVELPPAQKRRAARPTLPGTMSGFMDGNEIRMGEERPAKKQKTAKAKKSKKGQTEQDPINVNDNTNPVVAGQPSELDILKAKLAQAEQRIQRLEGEKGSPAMPPPPQAYYYPPQAYHQPPPHYQYQHPPQQQWQPHPGYGPPPPSHPYPPQQVPSQAEFGMLKPAHRPRSRPAFAHPPAHATFGILKLSKGGPAHSVGEQPFLPGIVEAAAGATSEAAATAKDDTNALVPSRNDSNASTDTTPSAERTGNSTENATAPATSEDPQESIASSNQAVSRPITNTPAHDVATTESAGNNDIASLQSANPKSRMTLATRAPSSMNEVRFYTPKLKPDGRPI